MLPLPNTLSSDNESNDSDDFAIIDHNSLSPQINTNNNNTKYNIIISNEHEESHETDDFEHLTIDNLSNSSNSNNNNITTGEQSEFDIINLTPNDASNDTNSKSACAEGSIVSVPGQLLQPTNNNTKSDSSNSAAPTPNATVEDIISMTEPLNASNSSIDNMDRMDTVNEKHKSVKYQQLEYDRYVSDKTNNNGCNSWFCLQTQSMQNGIANTRQFFENVSCITNSFSNYMDRCFGGDQFNEKLTVNKSVKKV